MKSKGIFIKENVAKLSVEPTLVSLSGCPNFVEFEKVGWSDKLFYLKIVGDGYEDYAQKPTSKMFFFTEKNILFFIPTHKTAPNDSGGNIGDNIKTFRFDITDATNNEIAARLKESLLSSNMFSSYNIHQVSEIDGQEDTKGTIVRFTAKGDIPQNGFTFNRGFLPVYTNKFQRLFAQYSTNPFEDLLEPINGPKNQLVKETWNWKYMGANTSNMAVARFSINSLDLKKKYMFHPHEEDTFKKYIDGDDTYVFQYPYTNSQVQNATNLVEAMNAADFLKNNFNIWQKIENGELTNEIIWENKTQSLYNGFTLNSYFAQAIFNTQISMSLPNPFEKQDALTYVYNPDKQEINLQLLNNTIEDSEIEKLTTINIIDENNELHTFRGTKNKSKVNPTTFYVESNHKDATLITAENIKNCLKSDNYLTNNYQIEMSFKHGLFIPVIVIKAIDNKKNNNLKVAAHPLFISFEEDYNQIFSTHSDSIFDKSSNAAIELEVYTNTGSFLGENTYPENSMGTYMATLRKTYYGQPLWFEINNLIANRNTFSSDFLETSELENKKIWHNAGTAVDYRFIARRFDGINREPIYLSDVLYSITGYGRNLEENSLGKYIYNAQLQNKGTLPLTNNTKLTHIEGQSQYFNFILQDKERNTAKEENFSLVYRLFTQSGALIEDGVPGGKYKRQAVAKSDLHVVNTTKLEIDEQIAEYKKLFGENAKQVGFVKVSLCHTLWKETEDKDGKIIKTRKDIESKPLEFKILPKCLHKVNDFAFLNALGGWSSFNFGGEEKTNFRASGTNIYKTQTPHYRIDSEIESVNSQDVKEVFSVKSSPIDVSVVEWLKEMSASLAVYELSSKRYIIVDEMNIQPNTKDELFTVEMKYRYSDSFNGRIK